MESPWSDPPLLLEDFGQRVDLTRRIREVLVNYPEGTTVLKELIQNADDAGATKICFCLDRRSHGVESLLSGKLSEWQGPALLAFNDAEFSEDDFVSISRIGDRPAAMLGLMTAIVASFLKNCTRDRILVNAVDAKLFLNSKSDSATVVGFNSVYHLTDLPSFVSGKYVVLFDPQGIYLPNVSSANPGKRIEYVSSSAISLYQDQFFPYCAFGCDMKNSFPGTLFRFPLRNADQAAVSKLSRQAYLEDDISSMFTQLYEEGVLNLLFLKNILSIEMYIWSGGDPEPQKLYSCSVSLPNDQVVWHRKAILRLSDSISSSGNEMDSFSLDFLSESFYKSRQEKKVETYYIVQAMASESSRIGSFALSAAKEYDIHLLPWASVAACIPHGVGNRGLVVKTIKPRPNRGSQFGCFANHHQTADPQNRNQTGRGLRGLADVKHGLAFCSLPLPLRTGLSVQVNGYFELSSNRRSIWYGDDMDRGGKLRSDWNRLLLEDVVAPAFMNLLLGARGMLSQSKLYYSLWPNGSFEEPWGILVRMIYKSIAGVPVLFSDIEGGKWVSPRDAFLHDEEFAKSKELGQALLLLRMPIVYLQSPLIDMLLKYGTNFYQKVVTPATVREFLRDCKGLLPLSRSDKLVLLEYCLEDVIDADVGRIANGLPLVPLASNEFGSFCEGSQGVSYFICNELEYKLLQKIPNRIIDRDIPNKLLSRLSGIASTSTSNIMLFDFQCFLQLFPVFFPSNWKYKSKVTWDPECSPSHPEASWFMIFWQYLRIQGESETLFSFSDWPILPSTSGHLYAPSKSSKLINADTLSDKMKGILAKIGCKMLNPYYGVEHRQLSQYVYNANGGGVLDAIFDAISLDEGSVEVSLNISADEKNELCLFLFDPKWYVGDGIAEAQIQKCKRLPIYTVYSGGSIHVGDFSDLISPQKYLPPLGVPEHLLGNNFVKSISKWEEDILVRYYGIERMGKACFYRNHVMIMIHELQPEIRDRVMLSVLHDLPQLCLEDASLRESLRKLEFVPTRSGSLKCPDVLYDPRNEELYELLEDSNSFPYGLFQKSDVLDMLQSLGLRTYVSPETIIHSARHVELLMQKDQAKAHSRGKVLLSYLEANATKWSLNLSNSGKNHKAIIKRTLSHVTTAFKSPNQESDVEKFWDSLRMISWCPVLVSAPYPTLPWPSVSSVVAPPKQVRLQTDLWIASASMRILDGECSSTSLSLNLGWLSPPGGSVIAAQLLELGKNNEITRDQVLRQELAVAMPRIYSLLMGMIGTDEMEIVKAVLEGCRWIWVGDGFATLNEVVLSGPLHLAPYLRVIPVDLAVFKELFMELGIREFLKPSDYADILCRMAGRKGNAPLDAQELRAAVLIVQYLAEAPFQDYKIQTYLPDTSCRLLPASTLVFNDAPWLLGLGDTESTFGDVSNVGLNTATSVQKFVHGNISNEVAEKLGVRSLRRILLAESADSMNLSLSGAVEAFGQHEALTTRLKHIIDMYADGPGILFELVQNAEDAGASEVIFLLDKTHYGTSSVLSPEMAEWQGPALYCFNSSIFSPQDLYAISRIGQDSKLEKPFAIGRFGLGFNCVYHFTDIPSFVSGENIVMFDPHACNLPGISPSHPGLRIQFVGRRILEQFPDQFAPFLHFGCDLHHSFPGTLFRFPLRTELAASRSQIKKERYAPEDVLSLFSSFSEVASEALLFLRNVKSISLFVKDGVGHEMKLYNRVERNHFNELGAESHPRDLMLNFIQGRKQAGMDKDQFLNKLSKTSENDLPWYCQKIVITEEDTCGRRSHFWMMGECLGGGRARKKSIASENRSHNFVPWACIAAYMYTVNLQETKILSGSQSTESEAGSSADAFPVPSDFLANRRDFEGRAFCFLPLPISTGLPVHVNAYFELSSNRRDIWFGNDMAGGGKARSDWNIFLLEDVVSNAYGRLLEKIAQEIGPGDQFSTFWPTIGEAEPWTSMVRKLHLYVADLCLRVFHTKARGGQWISTKQAIFPDFSFSKVHELAEALSDADLPLITVSKSIVERFKEVCPSLHFLTPQLLRTLLIRRKRGFRDKDAIVLTLEYCLSDIKGPATYDSLHGLPLIPLANSLVASFNKRGEGERIFITTQNEYNLLKSSVPYLLIDINIPEELHQKLFDIAQHGGSNISKLSCHLLEELFPRILPTEWQNCKQVSWTPGHEGQPSLEWMRLLWIYLRSSCDDLSVFFKWPILPVANESLLQLVRSSRVIKDDGWSENMSSLLKKLGCLFLRSEFEIDHPQLKNFVQDSTASGILNALLAVGDIQNITTLFCNAMEGELHELRCFILQSKWFSGDQMNHRHIDIIKQIPMFESYSSRKLVSLSNPTKMIKPEGVNEDLLDGAFVRTESEKEKFILRSFLEIREPTRAEFYVDYVLNRISEFISQPAALSAILRDLKLLVEEDSSTRTMLSHTPFVLAANGTWKCPSRLYDPRVPGLKKLLYGEDLFPCDKFLDPNVLETLVSLGLKKNLGFAGLLDSARSISMMHDAGDSEAVDYGRSLLSCLDAFGCNISKQGESNCDEFHTPRADNLVGDLDDGNDDKAESMYSPVTSEEGCSKWDSEVYSCLGDIHHEPDDDFWSDIKSIRWCPVYVEPSFQGLPWLMPKHQIAPPNVVRPKSQMWMVSAMMHILDGECSSAYLKRKLGWLEAPNVTILSTQLIELSKSHCQLKLDSVEELALDAELQREIPMLYSKLQEHISSDDFNILKSALNGVSWVWIGDNFVSSNSLAFDSPVKFHPYLYAVPSELSEFKDLLLALGVKPTFESLDYSLALQHLQHDVKGLPLSLEQLNFVRCVLEAVADCYANIALTKVSTDTLLIPDSSGVLISVKDLVYNDAPWMENSSLALQHIVHPCISNDLANKLGVQSLRCLSLVDEDMTKNIPCIDYSRISKFLAQCGNTDFLLFDLLELADCCKTRKLHLIFDKREHLCESLLQHNLGEFQGPALVAVLEGATLSREEVSNLHCLPPWSGNVICYGLGMLSCYSICDLPSIVSGGYFYMFDPHGKTLGAPSSEAPTAKMFSLRGTKLTERFYDQFSPMLIGQNMPWAMSDSTVIRMPLTSQCMKDGLENGTKKIKAVFDRFMEHASRALLFLKSVLQTNNGYGATAHKWSGYLISCTGIKNGIFFSVLLLRFLVHILLFVVIEWHGDSKKWSKAPYSVINHSDTLSITKHLLIFGTLGVEVSISSWEDGCFVPCQDYLVCVDPSSAITRNPFSEKKWRKFQISRLFGNSNAMIKFHVIDVHIFQRETKVVDKWLVVLSLGSGQTRNMALDRRYLAYNLTPVAGVAAHVSRNGQPADACLNNCILSPLPLSGHLSVPVVVLGCFMVCHDGGRSLFKSQSNVVSVEQLDAESQLIEAWNRELMSCVCDSYVEMVLEIQKLRREPSIPSKSSGSSSVRAVSQILQACGNHIYMFWPRSKRNSTSSDLPRPAIDNSSSLKLNDSDWDCFVEKVIRPFYARLVDLPVWQLYSGRIVKAEEGMFLSQPGNEMVENLPPSTVCSFIKEHYPVFSVPWELVKEIQAVGVKVKEIMPKMVRALLKASSTSIVLRSVETYIDVLEYSMSDIELQELSNVCNGGTREDSLPAASTSNIEGFDAIPTQSQANPADALEMVTHLGRALFDFGRGVVEDLGRAGGPLVQNNTIAGSSIRESSSNMKLPSVAVDLKGLICPTATSKLARLGSTELWVGTEEQQMLMHPLASRFIHAKCMVRPILANIFSNKSIQKFLKLQEFSSYLLAKNMNLVLSEHWVNHVMGPNKAPWFSWENGAGTNVEGGPSPNWIRLFWKNLGSPRDLSLFHDWPLVPAFLGRAVLCRIKERHLIFIPPSNTIITPGNEPSNPSTTGLGLAALLCSPSSEAESIKSHLLAFEMLNSKYPWLTPLLNQCNIPVYDPSFLEWASVCDCFPAPGQSLGQVIVSKLVAAKQAGYFSQPVLSAEHCDKLFDLFASDFTSPDSIYKREELDILRDLPIFKTVVGTYTRLDGQDYCIISSNSFFKPLDEHCLHYSVDSGGVLLLLALGVPELLDKEILVRFALPGFEGKAQGEKEDILIYLCMNWQELHHDSTVIDALKDTKFVRNANELCRELYKPKDLYDPTDSLLMTVFSGDRNKFPGERFTSDEWLRVLKKTGLRTAMEEDVILECAKKVEYLGHECVKYKEDPEDFDVDINCEISPEIWSLASAVVEAIFSNFAGLYSNRFCDLLGKVAFVPAVKGHPHVAGKKGRRKVLCSYNEAILPKDWPLGWSIAPILASQNAVPPEFSWGALHLRSPPVFSTVLNHLQAVGRNGGEDTLVHWPMSSGTMTIEGASCEILKYLDKIWGSLAALDVSELQKVEFIPVANGTRLVAANSLFVHLTVNLSPFAFELPTLYLPFVKILKELGLQDELSLTYAKDLLSNLQKACGYQRLNPNELRAVMEILCFIYDTLVQNKGSDEFNWVSEAIVPDSGCRLVMARFCVYLDSYGSRFIKSIDISRLRFVISDVSEKMCKVFGVRKLSERVVEELDPGKQLQSLDQIGSVTIAMVREKLLSRTFQAAVWTVLQNITGFTLSFEDVTLERVQSSLGSIAEKLQFVKSLYTRFMLFPESLDITRVSKGSIISELDDGLGHRTLHYVDKSMTWILVAEPPCYMSVFDVIAIVVSQVLDSPIALPIGPLFTCTEGSEKAIVKLLKIGCDTSEIGSSGRFYNLLGKELMPQDAIQVQIHPLRPFYSGEIIAWRTGKDGEKLRYGRVPADVRPSAGQALYRFDVETASGEKQPLLSSQVFSFRSMSTASSSSLSNSSENGSGEMDNKKHGPMVGSTSSDRTTSFKSQQGRELQYGKVSAAELVQAVNDMLSAAGFNIDSEKQSILQTSLTLQDQLKESQAALLLEQEKSDTATKEAENAKAAWLCRICLSTEVDITLVPCGHVLCRRCSSAVTKCPFCRRQVSQTLKIFRP
ncbi:hypothetical protein Scep_015962 [Stephania cephalantha]|uniref:RING-type domain-containing protein n=1 Tax=Stephania cephalantha TaxID=152367 RepID=A0AAP0ILP1_9MAGN